MSNNPASELHNIIDIEAYKIGEKSIIVPIKTGKAEEVENSPYKFMAEVTSLGGSDVSAVRETTGFIISKKTLQVLEKNGAGNEILQNNLDIQNAKEAGENINVSLKEVTEPKLKKQNIISAIKFATGHDIAIAETDEGIVMPKVTFDKLKKIDEKGELPEIVKNNLDFNNTSSEKNFFVPLADGNRKTSTDKELVEAIASATGEDKKNIETKETITGFSMSAASFEKFQANVGRGDKKRQENLVGEVSAIQSLEEINKKIRGYSDVMAETSDRDIPRANRIR